MESTQNARVDRGRSTAGAEVLTVGSGPRLPAQLRPVGVRWPAPACAAASGPGGRGGPSRPGGRPVPYGVCLRRPAGGSCGVAAAGSGPRARRVRPTRCGWTLLVVLSVALGAGLGALVRPALGGDPGVGLGRAGQPVVVVVEEGDTVWSIASRVTGEDEDVRAVVDAIDQINDLEHAAVVPGQVLEIP